MPTAPPLETATLADWEQVLRVHLTGAFLTSQAAVPLMRARGGGTIVHLASQLGHVGAPGRAACCRQRRTHRPHPRHGG